MNRLLGYTEQLTSYKKADIKDILLNAVDAGGSYKDYLASLALAESKELLKERLDAIMQYKKKPKYFISISLLLTILFLGGFAYSGAYQCNALANDAKQTENSEMEYGIIMGEKWYCIENETQLRAIGSNEENLSKNYLLNNDIHLTDDWEPIGTANAPFTGVFDGNGSVIRGLTIKDPNVEVVGMFGYAKGAHIYNVTMRDYDILSAGLKSTCKSIAPIIVFAINTKSYDNSHYPKKVKK